jgi:hypothetical protein
MNKAIELPPLPKPDHYLTKNGLPHRQPDDIEARGMLWSGFFTPEQMREYARQAVLAERERLCKELPRIALDLANRADWDTGVDFETGLIAAIRAG